MSGEHSHFLIQPVELAADRVNQIPFSAAWKIGTSYSHFEQDITGEQIIPA